MFSSSVDIDNDDDDTTSLCKVTQHGKLCGYHTTSYACTLRNNYCGLFCDSGNSGASEYV